MESLVKYLWGARAVNLTCFWPGAYTVLGLVDALEPHSVEFWCVRGEIRLPPAAVLDLAPQTPDPAVTGPPPPTPTPPPKLQLLAAVYSKSPVLIRATVPAPSIEIVGSRSPTEPPKPPLPPGLMIPEIDRMTRPFLVKISSFLASRRPQPTMSPCDAVLGFRA